MPVSGPAIGRDPLTALGEWIGAGHIKTHDPRKPLKKQLKDIGMIQIAAILACFVLTLLMAV